MIKIIDKKIKNYNKGLVLIIHYFNRENIVFYHFTTIFFSTTMHFKEAKNNQKIRLILPSKY